MKQWLIGLIVGCAAMVQAQQVTLLWDASPSPGVINYRIYFGTNSGSYQCVTNVGLVTTQTVVLPHTGRWFFVATAVDTNGMESEFSNELQWEARPLPPRLRGTAWIRLAPEIWRSTNQVDWVSFAGERTWIAATNKMEFYAMGRLLIERVDLASTP